MKKPTRFCVMVIGMVLLSFLFLSSCIYKHYTGRYWLGKTSQTFSTKNASDEDNKRILQIVRDVAKEFGFVEDNRSSSRITPQAQLIAFGKGEKTGTKYNALHGSDAGIYLFVTTGPLPQIGIQDWSYVEETEFMKTFKAQLEIRLNEVVDMKNVQFIREFDFLN